jgi:hypothetical protein
MPVSDAPKMVEVRAGRGKLPNTRPRIKIENLSILIGFGRQEDRKETEPYQSDKT